MLRIVLLCAFIFSIPKFSIAQELNATVTVNSDNVPGSNKQVFKTLEKALTDFINNTQWTNQKFKPQERINCAFTIIVNEQSETSNFSASLQLQSSRPVYNSAYITPVLNINDNDFDFEYIEYQPIQYNENSFDSNLVSVLVFYVYTILGADADTFSPNGGLEYHQKAENAMLQAQQSGFKGWNRIDGFISRFRLSEGFVSDVFNDLKNVLYQYHILGMDTMHEDNKNAKNEIADAITTLSKLARKRPNSMIVRTFMDAKSDEIFDVFSDGPSYNDISRLRDNLIKLSPSNLSKWNELK